MLHTEGPALVVAGAGSGKTRVLTYRIAHLLEKGIPPYRILALTFTNKAAKEMQQRIARLAGIANADRLWMGTFHSIFLRILRVEASALGYGSNFTIYDSQDSRNLIKSIIKELRLDDKIYKPADVAGRISMAKNNLIVASAYAQSANIQAADKAAKKTMIATIYTYYEARCKQSDVMDFDDLLLQTNILFRDFPEILKKYQQKFEYLLVDEYQDTNYAQYLIIKKLVEVHQNICVVGDDAQSIYSFRGARIENILHFKNDYPEYQLFKLEQNYRSTATIVEAANSIIQKNKEQIPKNLFSTNETGEKIKVLSSLSDKEEGFQVTHEIIRIAQSEQQHYSQFAILYRTNAQSRILEESLRKRDIPYRIYGGISFYQRKEVKDLLAYLRLIVNPGDEEALRRIINYPRRGIGDTTIEKIREIAEQHQVSMWTVLNNLSKTAGAFSASTISRLENFKQLIDRHATMAESESTYEVTSHMLKASGIMEDLAADDTPEGISRKENIQELINAVKEFSKTAYSEGEKDHLSLFLQNIALMTDQDRDNSADQHRVTLMTVHSSKGLEFKHIFITGVEEELFPAQQSTHSPESLEEERRLFYVALTRAEKRVILSYASTRYKNGNIVYPKPSRFIGEINPVYVEGYLSSGELSPRERPVYTYPSRRITPPSPTTPKVEVPEIDTSRLIPVAPESVLPDLLVFHSSFGTGKVLSVEGTGINRKAGVYFSKHGLKTLLLKYAKLFTQRE